jgi:integrase
MGDYKKIAWQSTDPSPKKSKGKQDVQSQVNALLELCKEQIPSKILEKSCDLLNSERSHIEEMYKKIVKVVSQLPLLSAFIVWAKEASRLHLDMLTRAKVLVESGYIGIKAKDGALWTLGNASEFDHETIIDAIRCRHDLSISMREQLVADYISFIQWLHEVTHGYISKLEDPDRIKTQGKFIDYPVFLSFLEELKINEQLVAKLLYFGGRRTLDEVLNLQLEKIDFEKRVVQFDFQVVSYPTHVFADIQVIAEKKKRGRLFIGRQNAPLGPATIFRNFKKAALKIGLEQNFAPAVLTLSG